MKFQRYSPHTPENPQNLAYDEQVNKLGAQKQKSKSLVIVSQNNFSKAEDVQKPLLQSDDEEEEEEILPSDLQTSRSSSRRPTPVIVATPSQIQYGPNPNYGVLCPVCHSNLPTQARPSYRTAAFVWCTLILCFASSLCAWIPFRLSGMKKVDHYCSGCNKKLGSYNKTPRSTYAILISVLVVGMALSVYIYYNISKRPS